MVVCSTLALFLFTQRDKFEAVAAEYGDQDFKEEDRKETESDSTEEDEDEKEEPPLASKFTEDHGKTTGNGNADVNVHI